MTNDELIADAVGEPVQIPYRLQDAGRRWVRTMLVWLIGGLVALASRAGIDLTGVSAGLVDALTPAVWGLVTGAVQWVILHTRVDDWLAAHWPRLAA